jgi:hypothetical protein
MASKIFYVTLRHMPFNHKWVVPVMARTLEEAKEKIVEWTRHNPPGAFEYYRVEG